MIAPVLRRIALLAMPCCLVLAADGGLLALPAAEQAAAVQALQAATRIAIPAGRIRLADALDLLKAGGNSVVFADGVDDRAEAELPAIDGAWWEAVRGICTAFSLRFDEGIPGLDRLDGSGDPAPVGHGPLVLSPAPEGPPAFAVAGAIAVAAEMSTPRTDNGRQLPVQVWCRAEPRIPRGRLAWARIADPHLVPAAGVTVRLQAMGQGDDTRPPTLALLSEPTQADTATLATVLTVRVGALERWSASCTVTPGAQVQVQAAGRTLDVTLLTEPGQLWGDLVLPERRPLVGVAGPAGFLASSQLRLRSEGADVPTGGNSVHSTDTRTALYRFPRNLPKGPIEVLIDGSSGVAPVETEVRIAPRARQHVTLPDPEAPSRVSWEAGSAPLGQWIARLAATGNQILPEVGIDTAAQIQLPAFAGTFWDGVIALCSAADLAPAIATDAPVAGGPLRLIRRNRTLLIIAACGPLVVVAAPPEVSPDGSERDVHIRLQMAAEPRFGPDRFSSPTIAWATYAEDQDGRVAMTAASPPEQRDASDGIRMRVVRNGRVVIQAAPSEGPAASVSVRVPSPATRTLTLAGLAMVQRVRVLHGTCELPVGGAAVAILGTRPVELSTVTPGNGQPNPDPRGSSGILARGVAPFETLSIAGTGEDGTALEVLDEPTRMPGFGREAGARMMRCKLPAAGSLAIELTARESRPALSLPLRLTVQLP